MKSLVFFLPIIFLLGCQNTDRSLTKHLSNDTSKKIKPKENLVKQKQLDTLSTFGKSNNKIMIFSYKNDTISQEVKIEFLNKKSLHFDFTIENGKRNRTKEVQGIAQLPDGIQDVGTNTDENGIDYFVRTFSYEKDGCTIDIDIDSDTKDKLQVMETNCLTSHDKFCPFASVGILRLKK